MLHLSQGRRRIPAAWRRGGSAMGRVLEMDSRRRRKLSGVMVALMAEWPGKVGALVLLREWTKG